MELGLETSVAMHCIGPICNVGRVSFMLHSVRNTRNDFHALITPDTLHSRTTVHYSNQAGCISNGSQHIATTCLLFCNVRSEFNSTMWMITLHGL